MKREITENENLEKRLGKSYENLKLRISVYMSVMMVGFIVFTFSPLFQNLLEKIEYPYIKYFLFFIILSLIFIGTVHFSVKVFKSLSLPDTITFIPETNKK